MRDVRNRSALQIEIPHRMFCISRMQKIATEVAMYLRHLRLFLTFAVLLGDDEGLGTHPVGVTQHTQRTDLELIDSSHSQAAES